MCWGGGGGGGGGGLGGISYDTLSLQFLDYEGQRGVSHI